MGCPAGTAAVAAASTMFDQGYDEFTSLDAARGFLTALLDPECLPVGEKPKGYDERVAEPAAEDIPWRQHGIISDMAAVMDRQDFSATLADGDSAMQRAAQIAEQECECENELEKLLLAHGGSDSGLLELSTGGLCRARGFMADTMSSTAKYTAIAAESGGRRAVAATAATTTAAKTAKTAAKTAAVMTGAAATTAAKTAKTAAFMA